MHLVQVFFSVKLKMFQGAAIAVFAYFVAQATCINIYSCKSKRCEVPLRIEPGWVCGRVRAAEDGTPYASFRGVPYGMPPTGHRRFKELELIKPWNKTFLLDATEDCPACPQTGLIYGRIPLQLKGQSEDCIYLNLHVPYRFLPRYPWPAKGPGLPILVFIHGGAFHCGAGLTDAYGPEYLLRQNVILITFNYRINVFGFLSLNCKEIPGNQGFRDMVTLLRWVQRNARAFGGDPSNVTLMGQSAGATSAHILSLSKATKGLFKRVILMSCTALPSYFTTSAEMARKVTRKFLKELGINHTDPALIHRELIKMPLLKIMHANSAVQFDTFITSFNPIVESNHPGSTTVLDDEPETLMAQGRGCEYPMLISYTDNEMAFAKWIIYEQNTLAVLKQDPTWIVSPRLACTLPEKDVKKISEKIGQRYFNGTPTSDGVLHYFTDMFFKHPALKVAEWRAAAGGAPTYMYKFAHEFDYSPIKAAHWVDYRGSAHMDDMACVFRVNSMLGNYISYPPKNIDDAMKSWMVYIITNFMNCSNPTCNNNKLWPSISKKSVKYNLIRDPMRIHMMEPTAEEKDMVKFFDSFDPESRFVSNLLEAQSSRR